MIDGEATAAHLAAIHRVASTAKDTTAMTTTAAEIRVAMETLGLHHVADHFSSDVDSTPLLVCEGVSVDAFNGYVGDGEGLPIGVRFLELGTDGRLWVVDSATCVHEATASQFERAFLRAFGNGREISITRSMTAHRHGLPNKEADATFGPLARTPYRTPPPPNVTFMDWITLAVEVGRCQSWVSLSNAARWWYGYPGIQYVLLIKISASARSLGYRLYDVGLHPLGPNGELPNPEAVGRIRHNGNAPPENVVFESRRILSIPAGQPVPDGVNDPDISVDLRDVMTMVIDSLGPR